MKKMIIIIAVITVLSLLAGGALADTVQFRLVVSRNDAAVGGELHVDVEMRIKSGDISPRTLLSFNVDVIHGPELTMLSSFASGWAVKGSNGYTKAADQVPAASPDHYRVQALGLTVNEDCDGTGLTGFNVTNIFQKIVTLKWEINTATTVNLSIDDATDAASYYINLGNNPCVVPAAEEWAAENEDLGDVAVPVELSLFTVEAMDMAVQLTWRTETETENLGFNVYRSLAEDGDFARINDKIIKGGGSTAAARDYSYIDNDVIAGNTYYYKLADVDFNGATTFHGPISAMVALPEEYALEQNYPNPFNPNTAIKFSLKEPGHVNLQIYNIQGQLIRTLVDKEYNAGRFSVNWQGKNDHGAKVASGIYLYKLEVNSFRQIKRMLFLK